MGRLCSDYCGVDTRDVTCHPLQEGVTRHTNLHNKLLGLGTAESRQIIQFNLTTQQMDNQMIAGGSDEVWFMSSL